eukprot:CAMPEP_0170125356 /NCGR_PEP_ID=MMETSP0020_2-20130122/18924_1 /TAXON_ID=98059 /ORGANISM="Dinobryon sp., Strain UTEXLB2267" /LENGTH=49 /DNA_ID= /DNA_START= /DNA_END= /DNA_ORIENTATION=
MGKLGRDDPKISGGASDTSCGKLAEGGHEGVGGDDFVGVGGSMVIDEIE